MIWTGKVSWQESTHLPAAVERYPERCVHYGVEFFGVPKTCRTASNFISFSPYVRATMPPSPGSFPRTKARRAQSPEFGMTK